MRFATLVWCLYLLVPLLTIHAEDAQVQTPTLKELKTFPKDYAGKTVVLKNVLYHHKIEQQHDYHTFHVGTRDAFTFMLKEVVATQEGIAMITSRDIARKLFNAKLDEFPRIGENAYSVNLKCKVEKKEIATSTGKAPLGLRDGKWPTLRWADHKGIEVGQDVVAIGYAKRLKGRPTVTRGIISADERSTGDGLFSGLLQTDAAINPGNSGGPLLNMHGEVVGVNTFTFPTFVETEFGLDLKLLEKALNEAQEGQRLVVRAGSPVKVTQGIFFSRSCQTAQPFVEMLIEHKKVGRASLGDNGYGTVERDVGDVTVHAGVRILKLKKESPADKAGLQLGDLITRVGSDRIEGVGDLNNVLGFLKPGATVEVWYLRPDFKQLEDAANLLKLKPGDPMLRKLLVENFATTRVTLK